MQKTEQHCFYILLSRGFARPSHPSNSPTYFTFLPVKTSTSRCCYLRGFQQPVTSTSFSLLQKLSPASLLDVLPLRLPVPAGRCSRRCQTLCGGEEEKKKEEPTQGSEWWEEGGRERLSERLRGPTAIRLLFIFFPSVSKADFIDFSNLKHSHSRTFHRPIDWNWLPWGSLVL